NAGGTGVWILPRAGCVNIGLGLNAVARETRVLQAPLNADCGMLMSVEVGNAVATFVDTLSAVPVSLPVNGSQVRLPASLLQALAQTPTRTASVLITDAAQVGYVMHISIDPQTGNATIRVM